MSLVQRRNICLLIVVCCSVVCVSEIIFLSRIVPITGTKRRLAFKVKTVPNKNKWAGVWSIGAGMKERGGRQRGNLILTSPDIAAGRTGKYFLKQTTNNLETEIILLLAWSAVNDDCNYFLSEIGYFFHTSCWNLPTYRYFVGVRR